MQAIKLTLPSFMALLLLQANLALANDSMAVIEGQNLILKNTKDVAMLSEELFVSENIVRVDYEFKNTSNKPIKTIIAFPIPRLEASSPYSVNIDDWLQGKDPLNFVLKVNGNQVKAKIEAKKIIEGPVEPGEYDYLDVQYFWEQSFAPGEIVRVSHSYDPGLGKWGMSKDADIRYCSDAPWKKSYEKLKQEVFAKSLKSKNVEIKTKEDRDSFVETYMHFNSFKHLSYIVKTAKNWAGPIGHFKLTIEKPNASTLIGTCWPGLKKVAPTRFEFNAQNFVPTQELNVVFMDTTVTNLH